MKQLLLVMGLCCVSQLASAQVEIMNVTNHGTETSSLKDGTDSDNGGPLFPELPAVSYFDRLNTLFSQGRMPENAELLGWYTGRCFFASNPNTPGNALLVGTSGQSGGVVVTKVMTIGYHNNNFDPALPANVFDHLTSQLIQGINALVTQERDQIAAPLVGDNMLVVNYRPHTRWQVRTAGQYLVMQWFHVSRPHATCYYFNRVHE